MLYQQRYGFAMAEKGGVRRMNTRSSGNSPKKVAHESKWRKSQDHFECFTNLIGVELEDELNQVQERWKNWSKQKMLDAGLALFDLTGRSSGRFLETRFLFLNQGEAGNYHSTALAMETWS